MAYTPSLADLPTEAPKVAYTPTLADLEGLQAPAQPSQAAISFVKNNPRISQALASAEPVLNKLANNPVTNFVLGAGDAARSTLNNIVNLAPGINLPNKPSVQGSPLSYTAGKIAGDIGTFIGGGAGLNAVRGAAEVLPVVGKAMQAIGGSGFLPGLTRRAIGSAGYGALMRPDNRTGGATEGAALSAIADSIPGTFGLIGKGINAIRPQKFADDLVQNLGAGKSLENNAQSLAQDIQNAYTKRMQEGSQLYQPVFNQAGNSNLYQALENGAGKYQGLTDDILKNYDFDLKDLHNTFTNNPTFQNAHELKSQLGSAVRQLSKNPAPDQATRNTIQAYQRAKGAIDADMQGFLNNAHPDLGAQYQAANNYWATHVAPYRDSSQLLKIASGDVTNPRNISSLFKNPEPEIQKVLSDLPEGSNYKILYNELGKSGAISKPENLLKAYEKLDDKGLSSYVTPDLANKMDTLTSRVKNRDFAQRGVGFLGGALGARLIPGSEALPWVAEGIGGAIGATGAPKAMQAIQRALPQSTGNLTRGIGNAYNLTAKAALANLLAGDQ